LAFERARIEYREIPLPLFEESPGESAGMSLDWQAKLETIDNPAIVTFFRSELLRGTEAVSGSKWRLTYRLDGKMRWTVAVGPSRARVMQRGRFECDTEYWKTRLTIQDVKGRAGDVLRFYLKTRTDCKRFLAAHLDMQKTIWQPR
jgi:hypothetical protein